MLNKGIPIPGRNALMKTAIETKFIAVANAGHFIDRDGYREFPKLLEIINDEISLEK